jgi:hypothetical protein
MDTISFQTPALTGTDAVGMTRFLPLIPYESPRVNFDEKPKSQKHDTSTASEQMVFLPLAPVVHLPHQLATTSSGE